MSSSRSKVMIGFITVSHLTAVVLCCVESSRSVHCDHPHSGFRSTGSLNMCYALSNRIYKACTKFSQSAKTCWMSDVYFFSLARS